MFDMDVEEMPIDHSVKNLSKDDINLIIGYRRHDVLATLCLLYLTLGKLDLCRKLIFEEFGITTSLDAIKDYEGKNKIQDRIDVKIETGLECMNWSDVKIGEEWNKLDYKKAENLKDDLLLYPKKVKHPYGQKFKNFFPPTVSFKTEKLQTFIKEFGEEYVKNQKQEFNIEIGKTIYTVAKGGIHSKERNRKIVCEEGWRYDDLDIGSQYPNSITKLFVHAPHLKPTILEQYKEKISRRLKYKNIAGDLKKQGKKEEARPYSSIQEMLKLCLNGGPAFNQSFIW